MESTPSGSDDAIGNDETAGIKVQRRYNATGTSYELVSNPYRATVSTGATAETAMGWTITRHDTNGRVCRVETSSGTALPAVPACATATTSGITGSTGISYGATAGGVGYVKTVDPQLVTRQSYQDGAGRLVAVVEAPGGVSYHTYYGYDARGNLSSVRQPGPCTGDPVLSPCTGGPPRDFFYTSLGRLRQADNPESGSISFVYDAQGNLFTRTAGTTTTTMLYDALDRVTDKSYTGSVTPAVSYIYDVDQGPACGMANYPMDRLTRVRTSKVTMDYGCWDALGRARTSRQSMGSGTPSYDAEYPFSYNYGPLGPTSTTYPSGRAVTQSYDAAGRISSVGGTLGGQSTPYVSSVSYEPHGGFSTVQLGNAVGGTRVQQWCYNGRMQPVAIRVGASVSGACAQVAGDLFNLGFGYGSTDNNGNVMSQTIHQSTFSASQSYGYDGLNRLSGVTEGSEYRNFGYSYQGNMWVTTTSTGWAPIGPTPRSSSWFNVNNQLENTALGIQYERGNLIGIDGTTSSYDVENRMVSTTKSGVTTTFEYDGEGRRVKKGTTVYVYDAFGNLTAEYGGTPSTVATQYLIGDPLGSTRQVLDSTWSIVQCHDYFPFGEELKQGNDGRPACYSATTDPAQKFTGKERDAETDLDYFGARYMSSAQGRFTSADTAGYASLRNPQAWNLYAYALNNPLKFVDPDGHEVVCQGNADDCKNAIAAATGNARAAERVSTTTTTTQHSFLGIHWTTSRTTISISGDMASFRALGQNASRLADLVSDRRDFGFNASSSTYKGDPDGFWNTLAAPGARPLYGGGQSLTPSEGYYPASFVDPRAATYKIDTDAQASGIPPANMGEKTAHELFGHLWGEIFGGHPAMGGTAQQNTQNKQDSLDAENAVRRLDPQRGQKTVHH